MRKAVKDALARITSVSMFSKHGWQEVHKHCYGADKGDDVTLADAFIEYQRIWYEDNGIEPHDVDEDYVQKMLMDRFSDYLLND